MNLFTSNKLKEAWEEWLQYRKERRLPKYTPTGIKRTFAHLLQISNGIEQTAIEIINQSIAQNWQGLFPLKNQPNGNTTRKLTRAEQHEQGYKDLLIDAARRNGHDASFPGGQDTGY